MILVRPYHSDDRAEIERMHAAQGFAYEAPDWDKVLVSAVIEVDGRIQMAAFLRKTAEGYLLFDPTAEVRKRERLGQLLMMHKELVKPAARAGFDDLHCWLPPELADKFGKLLLHLGWTRPEWPSFHYVPQQVK